MKRLVAIQHLRAAAVLGVVIFHARQWNGGGFNVGRAGVDVFFVVSGVIMWRLTGAAEARPAMFLWRRITRVAPLYWLATLATAGLALAWPGLLDNVQVRPGHLLMSLAFVPHLDPAGRPFPLLPPGWTLSYEAAFYLVFAGALLAPRRRQAAIVCSVLFVIVAAGIVLADPVYILGANPLMFEFAAGVAIANLAEMGALPGVRGGWLLIAVGVAGLAVPAALSWFSELGRPFIWGAPATAIVAGALAVEAAGATPAWPALARIGDASYALYLVHLPVQAIVAHALGVGQPWLFVLPALVASLAAGLACHALVEKPLIAAVRRTGNLARRQAFAAGEQRVSP